MKKVIYIVLTVLSYLRIPYIEIKRIIYSQFKDKN